MTLNTDICNLDLIYQGPGGFNYSMPKNLLEGFLSGKAFDHKEFYSQSERERLDADIRALYDAILSLNPVKEKNAIMTAGAPGAGKTLLLRQDLEKSGKNIAYTDPDDVCLKGMKTYQEDIKTGNQSKEDWQKAYNKWRPGSNAAAHITLANLIRENYAFYFGTTSTGPATHIFFKFLKDNGYKIRLLHISASDDVRWGSIEERDKSFVQTTEQDVREKGFLLPQRINDTFLKYADEIEFYYREDVKKDGQLAATWIRNPSSEKGFLQVIDELAYGKIKTLHNETVSKLERPDLLWDSSVEAVSNR